MDFPGGSDSKESAYNAGDLSLIPGLGRPPGEGNGYPLQYSSLENSVDCIVHGVSKSQTRLSDFHFSLFSESSLTEVAHLIYPGKIPWRRKLQHTSVLLPGKSHG